MHKQIIKIKKYEGNCFIIKNFLTIAQIKKIQIFYKNLPVEIDNKRQKIVKKKMEVGGFANFEKKIFKMERMKLKKKIKKNLKKIMKF